MSIPARVRKCITQYGSGPINLFNQMGRAYAFGEGQTIYLDCITKIGVKQDDTHYLLAYSACEFVIIQRHEDTITKDNRRESSGLVYYFPVTDKSRQPEILEFRELLTSGKKHIDSLLQAEFSKLNLPEFSIQYSYSSVV